MKTEFVTPRAIPIEAFQASVYGIVILIAIWYYIFGKKGYNPEKPAEAAKNFKRY